MISIIKWITVEISMHILALQRLRACITKNMLTFVDYLPTNTLILLLNLFFTSK